MPDEISLDYETKSRPDLKRVGLDVYSAHPECDVLMGAYSINRGRTNHFEGNRPPAELREALLDPKVEKWAFNAQFERVITRRALKIKTPYEGWRCTMALAYSLSFVGTLEQVGRQVGLPLDKQKLATGSKLIKLFTQPQKVTAKQPIEWRNSFTNPVEWDEFCDYNIQDDVTENAIKGRLLKYPHPPEEWELYELDQRINDRGLPIDMTFVHHAIGMAARRKAELKEMARDVTGLANPFSGPQLLPWLKDRGYPFSDLQKATVKKVLAEHEVAVEEAFGEPGSGILDEDAVDALKLRSQAVRTSTAKYDSLARAVGPGDRFRFGFQFKGASRTARWAGRRYQPHNLVRTPGELEPDEKLFPDKPDTMLEEVTETIRRGDYEHLKLLTDEPMNYLAGTGRSAIRAPEGYELRVCDLSAIETCVSAWLCGCERMLDVIRSGKDPYKDFATDLFDKLYDEITKKERTDAKPGVLGGVYRLGGGDLKDGKRTGLWGYAESMGINLAREQSQRIVKVFREAYPEYPKLWYALEDAAKQSMKRPGAKIVPIIRREGQTPFRVPVTFEYIKPFLTIILPIQNESGVNRRLYYHLPRIVSRTMTWADGKTTTKDGLTYMGQPQGTKKWVRMDTHGGKLTENIVQAIARDVLAMAMKRSSDAGFNLIGHVHDELIALQKILDKVFTADYLREFMIQVIRGLDGLPLGSSAEAVPFYRK